MASIHNYDNYEQPPCPKIDKSILKMLLFTGLESRFFPVRNRWQRQIDAENAQPAYAPGFGMAGAHLSRRRSPRRPKEERPASDFQRREKRQKTVVPLKR